MRLGIIGSSGGSALAAAVACLKEAGLSFELVVACDRDCGMSNWASRSSFASTIIPYDSAERFSSGALSLFREHAVEDVLLFYTRRVSEPLIDNLRVYNIHPSLLPAFPGLHSVADAVAAGARILGASLHGVVAELDAGPIVAQIANGLRPGTGVVACEKMSYLQKVYLTLVWFELIAGSTLQFDSHLRTTQLSMTLRAALNASPSLADPSLAAAFDRLQRGEGCRIVDICPVDP